MILDFNNLTIEQQNKFDEIFHKKIIITLKSYSMKR